MDILQSCDEFAKQVDDPAILARTEDIRQMMSDDFKPTVLMLDGGFGAQSALDAASAALGYQLPDELTESLAQRPVCLTVDSGVENALYRVMDEGIEHITYKAKRAADAVVEERVFTAPCAKLDEYRVMICSGVEDEKSWRVILDSVDAVLMRVNATMAMTFQEKQWIEKCLIPRFGRARVAVWVDMQDRLNSDEDRQCVLQAVKHILERNGMNCPIMNAAEEAAAWMNGQAAVDGLYDKRMGGVMRNFLNDLSVNLRGQAETYVRDANALESTVQQLTRNSKQLEVAGRVAADTVVTNQFDQIEVEVLSSARSYIQQMVDELCRKIQTVSVEELEDLENNGQVFLSRAWSLYMNHLQSALDERIKQCYNLFSQRMENDIGALYAQLDDEALETLDQLLSGVGVSAMEDRMTPVMRPLNGGDLSAFENLKKETRNMMLLSVPMVFVNPLLSVATLVGARFYSSIEKKHRASAYRLELETSIRGGCARTMDQFCQTLKDAIESAKRQSVDNVSEAYGKLTERLVTQVRHENERWQKLKERSQSVLEMCDSVIPELSAKL